MFLASTINGYEGTGRSLSLKLLQQLRQQAAGTIANNKGGPELTGFKGFVFCCVGYRWLLPEWL